MAACTTYLEYIIYVGLLFFVIPIRVKHKTNEEVQFEQYLKNFNKSYTDPALYEKRFQAFQNSLRDIEVLNSNQTNHSAQYGLTRFSDLFPDEFLTNHLQKDLFQRIQQCKTGNNDTSIDHNVHRSKRKIINLPEKIDWRTKNVVTDIKNQGSCGACWAFSAVESIESIYAIKTGKLEQLSVQEMIDCAGNNNKGCKGGDICSLLHWMKDNDIRLHKEKEYPLDLSNTNCRMNASLPGIQINEFTCENFVGYEDVILNLIARNGPVAIAINAQTWQNYIGGVIQFHCNGEPSQLNHAVVLVGYDLTAPIHYYIARNTWGKDFGEDGYLYLAIGKNICGLANEVTALTVL